MAYCAKDHLSSQLCVGSECFPHLFCSTVNQRVLDYDGVARVMADGTYKMIVH